MTSKEFKITIDAEDTLVAARDVLNERLRQIMGERFKREEDDRYKNGELSAAAACYARSAYQHISGSEAVLHPPLLWPFGRPWWKPTTARRDLVKAAALILAEIERLDRAEQSST